MAHVTLRLDRNDVGQILDGLVCRLEAWQVTQQWFEDGYLEEDQQIEECDDFEEAQRMVKTYERLIQIVREQL